MKREVASGPVHWRLSVGVCTRHPPAAMDALPPRAAHSAPGRRGCEPCLGTRSDRLQPSLCMRSDRLRTLSPRVRTGYEPLVLAQVTTVV